MQRIRADHPVYSFSAANPPIARVDSGETFQVETLDCFCNQLRRPEDQYENLDWDRINPVTGPVYVAGAAPGDVLKLTIHDVEVDALGVTASGAGMGLIGHKLEGARLVLLPNDGEQATFLRDIRIPLRPMIGVIGVAPEGPAVNSGTPDRHGGNMDNAMIGAGATLYLPVFAEGALLALGDLHAVMGDGEVCVTGLEIPGLVTLTAEVLKGRTLTDPLLENGRCWSTIASAFTLDEAVLRCAENMLDFLAERTDLARTEIAMLMSLAGQVQICQVVDPKRTARFVLDKKYLSAWRVAL